MSAFELKIQRWTILLGVLQVTFGCAVGFIPPPAVAWFRGIVMSHLEYTANGVLMIVLGLLVGRMRLAPAWLATWFVALQVGTWTNGTAGLVAAFTGATSPLMPTLNEKFPPPHGTEHPVATGLLMVCGVTVMIALVTTVVGLLRAHATPAPRASSL